MTSKTLVKEGTRTTSLLKYIKTTWGEHCFAVKIHGSAFQPRVIDILCCLYGIFVALEVKRPGNYPTPRQEKTIRDIGKGGGFVSVVWSNSDVKTFFDWVLDTARNSVYIGDTRADALAPTKMKEESQKMPTATRSKSKAASKPAKTSKRAAPIEDEDDDLDDLEDLDDLDDFVEDDEDDEDDEDEEDEDEEDEPAPVKTRTAKRKANDAKAAKAATARKAGPVKTTKAAPTKAKAKVKGAAPATRALGDGFVGAAELAAEVGVDGRAIRLFFRKNDVAKNADGRYAWKTGSREYQSVLKKAKANFS